MRELKLEDEGFNACKTLARGAGPELSRGAERTLSQQKRRKPA